jgi:hypothetical protein
MKQQVDAGNNLTLRLLIRSSPNVGKFVKVGTILWMGHLMCKGKMEWKFEEICLLEYNAV